MKIGIMVEGQEGLTWERWFAVAGQVEAFGLDSLWRSDHFFSVMGRTERESLEAWVSLTALAQKTTRIGFGPLVSPMTFRHPALLARMAAAVDRLASGRLTLGIGVGCNEADPAAYGITLPPPKEPIDRLVEGISVIPALLQGGPVVLAGRLYPLVGATRTPPPSPMPLLPNAPTSTLRSSASRILPPGPCTRACACSATVCWHRGQCPKASRST